jgi:hypothetical protein
VRIFIAIVVLLLATGLTSACGDKTPPEENEIRTSLNELTAAINSEDYEAAYAKYSNWCRQNIPIEKLIEHWKSNFGSGATRLELTDVEIVSSSGDMYQVDTTFQVTRDGATTEWGKESDPYIQFMVQEGGEWHIHDKLCELLGPEPGATPSPLP